MKKAGFLGCALFLFFCLRVFSQTQDDSAAGVRSEETGAASGGRGGAPAWGDGSAPAGAGGAAGGEGGASTDGSGAAGGESSGPEMTEEEKKAKAARDQLVGLDIKTSTLEELAEWSSGLGLGEGGSRSELEARIRNYYKVVTETGEQPAQKLVVIESARSTEYFTLEAVNEEYARLSGGVSLSMKDGDALHKIKAWEIVFNRTRNILTANGGVEYTKEENGIIEKFSGESITINLDTWIGNFIDSVSERAMESNETSYRFSGEIISRTDSETTVLKRAHVTNAGTEEPYWSLDASRMWLMPGSDWALANAVLKVGEIPVFWLPFFAYPVDEIVFHPVLGTRTREGAFVQTTTYILGRRTPDTTTSESSITNILGSNANMKQERHGLFLRSTKKREIDPNTKRLSVLADAYSKLGLYTGVDFAHPGVSVLKSTNVSFGLGWTRNIYQKATSFYIPFDLTNNWSGDNWNSSYLFGAKVPFRYRLTVDTGVSGKYGSVTLKFPMYSDPFIDNDVYLKRSEQLDWVKMLTSGTGEDTETTTTLGSYQWNISGTPAIPQVQILNPYITTMSVSSISSFLSFVPGTDRSTLATDDPLYVSASSPERQFFLPDKLTAYSISASIAGKPLTIGGSTSSSAAETPKDPLEDYGTPVPPWTEEVKSETALGEGANALVTGPPALTQVFSMGRNNALRFSIDYSFTPSSATELQYNKQNKTDPESIDWGDFQSILTSFRTDGRTTFTLSESNNNLFTTSLALSGNYQWQGYSYINKESIKQQYTTAPSTAASTIRSMHTQEYSGRQWTVNSSYNFTLNPFYWSDVFSSTNFQYTLGNLIAKSLFNSTKFNTDYNDYYSNYNTTHNTSDSDYDYYWEPEPEWETTKIWDADFCDNEDLRKYITSHSLSANLGMNILDKTQSLTFSATLPPLYQQYNAGLTARMGGSVYIMGTEHTWTSETSTTTQIQEDTDENKEKSKEPDPTVTYRYVDGYLFKPVYIRETLSFDSTKSLSFYTSYDPELDRWTNLSTTLTLWKFTSTFTMVKMMPYKYEESKGWYQDTVSVPDNSNLEMRDLTASFSYSKSFSDLFSGYLTFTQSLSTSLTIDLQRYTYSKFSMSLNCSLNITKFLDFTMGASVENAQIYWYFAKLFPYKGQPVERTDGFAQNIFTDLINSFRFDDNNLRKLSGFKLKSFNFSAVHHLGDWDATLTVSFSPELKKTNDAGETLASSEWHYWFKPTVSFLVQWVPLSEISTQIDYENEIFKKIERN